VLPVGVVVPQLVRNAKAAKVSKTLRFIVLVGPTPESFGYALAGVVLTDPERM
jgi:hypothetical protein